MSKNIGGGRRIGGQKGRVPLFRLGGQRSAPAVSRRPGHYAIGPRDGGSEWHVGTADRGQCAMCLTGRSPMVPELGPRCPCHPVLIPQTSAVRWRYDARCDVTPEDHKRGKACEPLEVHSHRDGVIKWARRVSMPAGGNESPDDGEEGDPE